MKKKYDKQIETRLAEIKQELFDLKHNHKKAPLPYFNCDQKEANLIARIKLFDEQEALYKEYGIR
jgi:ribosomal protein L29